MSAVRNGIKCTLRTPWKTLLFTLILVVLAVLLAVSFCVYAAVRGYLHDCGEFFHTIVELEFVGSSYPNDTIYDPDLVRAVEEHRSELDALSSSDALRSLEAADPALGRIDGLHRNDIYAYDPDAAVLLVYVSSQDPNSGAYASDIRCSLYAEGNVEGKMVMLRTEHYEDPSVPQPEIGATYLMTGHFFKGTSSYLWFQAEDTVLETSEGSVTIPAFTRVEDRQVPADSPYLRLADRIAARNDSCRVQRTAELEDLAPFHQQAVTITAGRSFTQEEYTAQAKVCVVSGWIAGMLELAPGSTIRLGIYQSEGDVYGTLDSGDFTYEDYRVVGICDRSVQYPFWVYIPDADAAQGRISPVNGSRLGQFRVENDRLSDFMAQAAPLTEAGFRFTAYDQGYAAAVEPMQELLLIAVIFLGICLLLTAAALAVQCHLFISRQRETAQTMYALGCGNGHIRRYFLAASAALAFPAAVLGAWLGSRLEREVLARLQRFAAQFAAQDLRYSATRVSLIRTLDFAPRISPWIYGAAGLTLILGAALLTLVFARGALRERKQTKRRASAPKLRALHSSSRLSGRFKYAWISIRRNRSRSAAVLLLSLVMALFFGQLTASAEGYRTQLEAYRNNSVITGHATDASGQRIEGLVVSRKPVNRLLKTGLITKSNATKPLCHCRYLGVSMTAEGAEQEVPEPYIPTDAFGIETLFGHMYYEPSWTCTSSVSGAPLFYYSKARDIQWAEGCSETDFRGSDLICALPKSMMEAHGIRLGDTVRFLYAYSVWDVPIISTVDLKVAACYTAAVDKQVIYSPIGCILAPLSGFHVRYPTDVTITYDSFLFTLDRTADLDRLRQALADAGFTPVRARDRGVTYAVIDDETYLNTVHSMERQIQYVTALYGSLYVMAGIIGFVLAWLMMAGRSREIAVMRALGTQPGRIAGSFTLEQLVLCGLGLGAGVLIWRGSGHVPLPIQYRLTAAYFGFWSLSSLICLLSRLRGQAYMALSEPE